MSRYGLSLALVFAAGMALGGFYFAVLWNTVRRLPGAGSPARLMLAGLLVRLGIVLPAFYLLMAGRWERMVVALGGFIVMREFLTRLWGKEKAKGLMKGAVHGHSGPQ